MLTIDVEKTGEVAVVRLRGTDRARRRSLALFRNAVFSEKDHSDCGD